MSDLSFAFAEVKALKGAPDGEFEAILSAETLDRDGEVIKAGAFEPLPASIPIHAYHDWENPVGRAVPVYENGVLKARGFFASTPRAQEIRTLVAEGVIGHTSVGFMKARREWDESGQIPLVVAAELLEASFVSIPSNRQAAVLMAKAYGDRYPETATTAPATPADEDSAGKSPASAVVELARARALLLSIPGSATNPPIAERGKP